MQSGWYIHYNTVSVRMSTVRPLTFLVLPGMFDLNLIGDIIRHNLDQILRTKGAFYGQIAASYTFLRC